MASSRPRKCADLLFPGEKIIDRLKFRAFYRPCEFVLTDRRLLVSGHTGALGPAFTLLRGSVIAGFPLTEYETFIIGTGKRPGLLLIFLALAVAGGVLVSFPFTRYGGLVFFTLAAAALLAWGAWPRTFTTIAGKGIRISGRVRLGEALVFLERLQLAAEAAKSGQPPERVRQAAALSGRVGPDRTAALGKDARLTPENAVICDAAPPKSAEKT